MNDLRELLATRSSQSDTLVLRALRDGLAPQASSSGPAAALHALLQGYFALDEMTINSGFQAAFQQHPDTARALLALLLEDGEHGVVPLMASLMEGRPQPTGALAAALQDNATLQAASASPGVQAAMAAFASTALATESSSAEIELSLAWGTVEGGLLDRVERQADVLAFAHRPRHRQALALASQLDAEVATGSIGQMLAGLLGAEQPRVLARPSEWDIAEKGAPAALVVVPVRHEAQHAPLGPAAGLGDGPAEQALKAWYAVANGADLFIPLQHEPHEAGLTLIPDSDWEAEREHVMTWLTLGGDEDELPDWAHALVPIAALVSDAGRWVVPLQGPLAGAVLLTPDDVHEEKARYPTLAHFAAALRLRPQEVLANGGYVSYRVPEHGHLLYPEGYAEGPA